MKEYICINGIFYKKSLVNAAKWMSESKDEEHISLREAKQLYIDVLDNGFVTEVELQTLRYIQATYNMTSEANNWLNNMMMQETPTQRAIKRTIREVADYSSMQWMISDEAVSQQEALEGSVPFLAALNEMLHSFLYQMESSESPRDITSLELGVDLEDRAATTKKLSELMNEGILYLFSENYMEQIETGELPFYKPSFTHKFEEYWTFGLLLPAIPNWHFIGFVNRNDAQDTYNTGFQAE